MRYFHQIGQNINVAALNAAIARQPELWNSNQIRRSYKNSAHNQASDILLRFNDLSKYENNDYSGILDDLDCINHAAFYKLPQARELIFDLMRFVEGSKLGKVVITKLSPGCKIEPHIDEGLAAENYDRYHITLKNGAGSVFRIGDEFVTMKTGDIYLINNQVEHEIINNGTDDRITLIIDICSK